MLNNAICVIMGYTRGDYYDDYTVGCIRLANDLGYQTVTYSMVKTSKTKNDIESKIYDLIDFSKYKGVVLNSKSFYDNKNLVVAIEKRVKASGVPYVVLGTSCFKNTDDKGYIFKDADRFEAVTDHVIEVHGCRNIHCLGGIAGEKNARVDGFVSSMKKHGLPVTSKNLLYGGNWVDCAKKYVKDIIFGNIAMPHAVVCVYDRIAIALVTELFRNGIKVPEDILVVGIDGESVRFKSVFSITTSPVSALSLGERAMAYLHRLVSGEEVESTEPEEKVVTGDSCGCGAHKDTLRETRRNIEKFDQYSLYDVYYRNSELQEKLFRISSYSDLPFILDNHTYLVPYMKTFSLSLVTGENEAECLFHSYFNYGGGRIVFDYTNVMPPETETDNMVRNVYVLPVFFGDSFYGYITAGYHQAIMYNRFLQSFCRDISISLNFLSRLCNTSGIQPVLEDNSHQLSESSEKVGSESSGQVTDTIYVKRDGVLSRVNIDNILYFEALDRKVYVALKSGNYEVKHTLSDLEIKLDTHNFMRVSKSVLLNLDRVVGVKLDEDRSLVAVMVTKQTVRISRRYNDQFKLRMGMK